MTATTHPNAERARDYLAAYDANDMDALGSFFSDDIVWRVGGKHPLSGTYRGKDAVLDYLRRAQDMTADTLHLEPDSVMASDGHVAMFLHITGERDGKAIDTDQAQVVVVGDDGLWREFWAVSKDQPSIDAFWA